MILVHEYHPPKGSLIPNNFWITDAKENTLYFNSQSGRNEMKMSRVNIRNSYDKALARGQKFYKLFVLQRGLDYER